ncbi:MAG: fumarylacetoacetase [Paracoccaceae bacterium]
MTKLLNSWVKSANTATTPFPLNNLPYGVFSTQNRDPRCGVAIGDMILDLQVLEQAGVIDLGTTVFDTSVWNALMDLGQAAWGVLRARLTELLINGGDDTLSGNTALQARALVVANTATLHMPIRVSEFTDFYASRDHAFNVGSVFRDPANALPPNWLHIPIGYNGRASSVVVSGTDIRRPWGQLKRPNDQVPHFAPSKRFDIELEMGAIVGTNSDRPITVAQADENIFGYVLLNDWSARDIQAWEYQPLGPFQSKATATTISAWIVTRAALEPFRTSTPDREFELLPHLQEPNPMLYDIDLTVSLQPAGKSETIITRTNYGVMYYSAAQQLAHHTTSGCNMRIGDLLGSGTISGPEKGSRGSLLELSWGGKEPFTLDTGEQRSFVEDGDTLTLNGVAKGDGYQIGFGPCSGTLTAAAADPYSSKSN